MLARKHKYLILQKGELSLYKEGWLQIREKTSEPQKGNNP
jgi:hypothetical protein